MRRSSAGQAGEVPRLLADFVPLSDARARLGESPVWSDEGQCIWWVDVDGRRLFRTKLDGSTESWPTPEYPGFVQCYLGEAVVGMETGIFAFDPRTGQFRRLVAVEPEGRRFNDSCTDTEGRIWAGTMDRENLRPNGILHLFDPRTLGLTAMREGFRTINGLAWDAARGRLHVSDSHPTRQLVWTCGLTDAGLAAPEVFARFDALDGRPDGALIDRGGDYWIAGVGGGVLHRFGPDGRLRQTFDVPLAAPTKPALIPGPSTLMVLTSLADDADGGRLALWRDPPSDLNES